jgi:hypothetical protein
MIDFIPIIPGVTIERVMLNAETLDECLIAIKDGREIGRLYLTNLYMIGSAGAKEEVDKWITHLKTRSREGW